MPVCYGIITSVLMNLCFIKVSSWLDDSVSILSSDTNNLDYIHQISEDWSTAPFVDIIVIEGGACPASHPDPVFSRTYYGADIGCNCIGVWPNIEFKDRFGRHKRIENKKNILHPSRLCSEEELSFGC